MNENLILALVASVAVIAISTALIMVIWNNVLIKKFPSSNIQKLDFWDALALSVFVWLLTGSQTVINVGK